MPIQKHWVRLKHDREAVDRLSCDLKIQPLTAALLISRGFSSAEEAFQFLNPSIEQMHDPYRLTGMRQAVARLMKAREHGEKVLVWGDYDVDGTTGTVLLRRVFRELGIPSEYHIPNRFTEGYGINIPALESAKARGCTLGISVDCGIRSFEPMEWAAANGFDFIITDHHLSDPAGIPKAVAVVNPNQADCKYPDKDLAGVGVALKLAHALLAEFGRTEMIPSLMEIAAMGTIADIMRLKGENRVIVSLGLREILNTKNQGLRALMEITDCTSEMTANHIGFRIAPRINAAGRMDVASHVVELFESEDFNEARRIARVLDSRNRERQQMQQRITEQAIDEYERTTERNVIVVAGEGWHRGVIGLAASKLAEKFYRPTIVLSAENGVAYGSARSIPEYNIVEALVSCSGIFDQFGGHSMAAGMQLPTENIGKLRTELNRHALNSLSSQQLLPKLTIDAPVSSGTLGLEIVQELSRLEPFGAGNPRPVFVTKGLRLRSEPFVMKQKHLRLNLIDADNRRLEAVWWDGVERSEGQTLTEGVGIEVAYTLEANSWQGNTRLQLVVSDLRADN
ncbi:single-stranded-DNA-specific exonuclease RecJ [Leptolyngbya sp. 7M]|uniref:single-stranded-DNA-specific exonuclease RecJ n=1 Tax=Leptolyngbya sp. 7M TaxID=2812896 RepID=UPI001B8AE940|nr:single-stranded-DNA-specific exonuclease RecJ [Leptolyngbya sp. 7M]QYO67560.1 single-stranded-DNA-specific exonuclease RecJ [Leptolyngbya sp. 7M]